MLRKEIHFTNFNGDKTSIVAYFHLSARELIDMEMDLDNGVVSEIREAMDQQDGLRVYKLLKEFITRSYGRKSADGNAFIKSPEATEVFMNSPAADEFIMELLSDSKAAGVFFSEVVPKDLHERAEKLKKDQEKSMSEKDRVLEKMKADRGEAPGVPDPDEETVIGF